ncbi:sulfatase-like hydrolase/transferase [Haloarchaeobius sp. TZWSO28]|uniref:sulfatase n=1 Tax=Haloarchaeobius sp. TZWSO28 TaxID=3446119 RepID=UPI003EB7A262
MNVLLLSIDSLRRDFLGVYRDRPVCLDYSVATPNLDAFAERAAVFDTHYAGSLPCMPTRREWQAGVQEFLWRPWGPMEPFDTSLALAAREAGVLTYLVTDHYHYFEHGSHGYYEDFNGFEFVRGNENDTWRTTPRDPDSDFLSQLVSQPDHDPHSLEFNERTQYARNAAGFDDESDFFAPQVFGAVENWLTDASEWDRWFCYVDSFDVHEPFHCPEPYASLYTDEDPRDPSLPLWPYYGRVDEGQSKLSDRELAFVRSQFAASVTMVDEWFGRVVDRLDETDAWDDTMVIVTSDHGFMLGEHGWIAKNQGPVYDIIANTPLLVWHPESPRMGDRVDALTSAIDLNATILEALGTPDASGPHSRSLMPLLRGETDAHRDWALYGYWGASVNITDGEYVYMHPCDPSARIDCHSTSMMNAYGYFTPPEPKPDAESGRFLPYTDTPVWRFSAGCYTQNEEPLLFDRRRDWVQECNLAGDDTETEVRMRDLLVTALDDLEAPDGQYDRLGLAR